MLSSYAATRRPRRSDTPAWRLTCGPAAHAARTSRDSSAPSQPSSDTKSSRAQAYDSARWAAALRHPDYPPVLRQDAPTRVGLRQLLAGGCCMLGDIAHQTEDVIG